MDLPWHNPSQMMMLFMTYTTKLKGFIETMPLLRTNDFLFHNIIYFIKDIIYYKWTKEPPKDNTDNITYTNLASKTFLQRS